MKNRVRVAAVQMKATDSIPKNTQKMLKFINAAKKKGVDIICFPECATIHDEERIIGKPKRLKELKESIASIKEKCRQAEVWCIFGTYEPVRNRIYNAAYVVDRSGDVVYKYNKVHLWQREKKLVTAGKNNNPVKTEFGSIGIITCWDFAFPAFIQKLSKSGARIIFCPSFIVSPSGTEKIMESMPVVRAFENIVYYVLCDAFHKRTASRSFIAGPYSIIKRIEKKEGMIYADLNLKKIDIMRKRFDTLSY